MARVSRSSKRQPAFDPSELKDLIFSPAVGTGVGSHLVGPHENSSAPLDSQVPIVVTSILPTVDMTTSKPGSGLHSAASILKQLPELIKDSAPSVEDMAAVVISNRPTVGQLTTVTTSDGQDNTTPESTEASGLMSTVVMSEQPTVDIGPDTIPLINRVLSGSGAYEVESEAEGVEQIPTDLLPGNPAIQDDTFVAEITGVSALSPMDVVPLLQIPNQGVIWITEQGDLVPQGRVKRIRLAQDVINSAEESVYDTLWTAKSTQADNRESFRVVQAGYDYLGKKTRLSKKTIQRIIAKLIDKNFIAIERPADIYQRSSTVYRVFSYKTVLEHHLQKGRSHVAKMGPGFSYVRPLSDPRLLTEHSSSQPASIPLPGAENMTTVVRSHQSSVPIIEMSTVVKRTTHTVPQSIPSTVANQTTTYIGKDVLEKTTSSSSAIYQALTQYGVVDDDILDRLIKTCKQQTIDCTEEEILHFIHQKGSLVRVRDSRIYSPIGFLLTAVPKCLSGEAFQLYRKEQAKRREAEAAYEARCQAELDEWRREQEARLADPKVSEEDKQFIRESLGIG